MYNPRRKQVELTFSRGAVIVDHDLEILGQKLDNVRGVLSRVHKDTWAWNFWHQVESQQIGRAHV